MAKSMPEPDLSSFDDPTNEVERCGVIVFGSDGGYEVVELPNRSPRPDLHFVVWNRDIHTLLSPDDEIVGVFHTHLSDSPAHPSEADIRSIPGALIGMVYHPATKSVVWYDHKGIIETKRKRKR
jgi:proteasome lid subunit RPN8/RPN11